MVVTVNRSPENFWIWEQSQPEYWHQSPNQNPGIKEELVCQEGISHSSDSQPSLPILLFYGNAHR